MGAATTVALWPLPFLPVFRWKCRCQALFFFLGKGLEFYAFGLAWSPKVW